jgi:hypothetical protein
MHMLLLLLLLNTTRTRSASRTAGTALFLVPRRFFAKQPKGVNSHADWWRYCALLHLRPSSPTGAGALPACRVEKALPGLR